ncbi:MAG: hypothetical protein ACYC6W_03150 [Nitrosotalea sp.]
MSKEIRIHKDKLDLIIRFDTTAELKQRLQDYDEIWKILEEKIGFTSIENRTITKEMEEFCKLQDNTVVLKKIPKSPLHTVILCLYAYGPRGANADEISLSTGIESPSSKIITPTKNKKYFRKLENNGWYLSDDGLKMIQKIIADLKGGIVESS